MQEEKRKADEARKHADSTIERNNRLIVNILAGRSYEEAAQMLGISVEDYSFQHLSDVQSKEKCHMLSFPGR